MLTAVMKVEKHKTLFVLTLAEYRVAQELVSTAVDFVDEYYALHPRSK